MPITLPNDLPAFDILSNEGVMVMSPGRAAMQDIRPLRIAAPLALIRNGGGGEAAAVALIAFAATLPPRLAPLVEVVLPDVSAPPSPERPAAPAFAVEVATADAIPSTNIEPDSVIHMRVFRDAANAADTYTGAVWCWQADLHYQVQQAATKNKAPNFYLFPAPAGMNRHI